MLHPCTNGFPVRNQVSRFFLLTQQKNPNNETRFDDVWSTFFSCFFLLWPLLLFFLPPSVYGVIKRGWFPVYVVSLFATYNALGQHNGLSQLSAPSVCAIVTHEITFCFAFVLVLTSPLSPVFFLLAFWLCCDTYRVYVSSLNCFCLRSSDGNKINFRVHLLDYMCDDKRCFTRNNIICFVPFTAITLYTHISVLLSGFYVRSNLISLFIYVKSLDNGNN